MRRTGHLAILQNPYRSKFWQRLVLVSAGSVLLDLFITEGLGSCLL